MSGKTFFSDCFGCVKAAAFLAFAVVSVWAAGTGAETLSSAPVVEISGDRISVMAENTPLKEILAEVSRLISVPIKVAEDNDHAVTINSRFSSVEELLRHMAENLALVYEELQDGGFRIVRAEVHMSAKTVQPEPVGSPIASPPVFDSQTELGEKPIEFEWKFDAGSRVSASVEIRRFPALEDRPSYRQGQLLVQFRPGAGAAEISDLHESMDCMVLRILPRPRIHQVSFPEGEVMEEIADKYRASPLVERVGRNTLRYPMGTFPDDPGFSDQWALTAIDAPQAWSINTGSPDIFVAVIDTGVDYTHPDLAQNIWINMAEFYGAPGVDDDNNGFVDDRYGWDFADGNPDPMDRFNHGTLVAGVIAAAGNNSIGIAGVSWHAKILPLKVTADSSDDGGMESLDIIAAIDYAIAAGARIVNCGFGGTKYDHFERNAFERLREAGILAVCAAGNSGRNNDVNPVYPASYGLDNIISVASTNEAGAISNKSNFGTDSVHLAAPGVGILSTVSAEGPTQADVGFQTDEGLILFRAIGMEYAGTTRPEGITGVLYDCAYGYSANFPAGVNGNIALIRRGSADGSDFYFHEKVGNAIDAGAAAVVIYNNRVDAEDDNFDRDGGTLFHKSAWIPAVSVSMADGQELLAMSQHTVTVRNVPLDADSRYAAGTGTSFATPHVSGVAALLYSIYPSLDYLEARTALLESVTLLSSGGEKIASGGVLNALNAILSLKPPAGDLTCDYRIGLDDAIVALQVMAGMNASVCPNYSPLSNDPEKDRRIGLAEALHALQVLAFPR